jgi:hypothetical protein
MKNATGRDSTIPVLASVEHPGERQALPKSIRARKLAYAPTAAHLLITRLRYYREPHPGKNLRRADDPSISQAMARTGSAYSR